MLGAEVSEVKHGLLVLTNDGQMDARVARRGVLEVDAATVEAVIGAPHRPDPETRLAGGHVELSAVLEDSDGFVLGLGRSAASDVDPVRRER